MVVEPLLQKVTVTTTLTLEQINDFQKNKI